MIRQVPQHSARARTGCAECAPKPTERWLGGTLTNYRTIKQSIERLQTIDQAALGGPPLWLRAEPSEDSDQADALAAMLAKEMAA